jgi:CubicO group peptidase (beta-lactamase class C family)
MMRICAWLIVLALVVGKSAGDAVAKDPPRNAGLSDFFPPPEPKGGWRTLLPENGPPDAGQKAKIREVAGVDWDRLEQAWKHNELAAGGTGLLVIRKGQIVGEWYRNGGRRTDYNIYSSSKSYTSTAFGLILSDFGNGALPDGRKLSLDTKICTKEWIPEALPLPDPRKSEITVRHLLNMTSGVGGENVPRIRPFEWSLGQGDGSPMAKLKGDPGTVFNYSNAGVAHLVLLFWHAQGQALFPFLQERLFEKIGMKQLRWMTIGGEGGIGPFSQGFSGIYTNPREHARFCYLALHKGEWAGQRVVPEAYYDFAWTGTKVKADYGAQWWVYPHIEGAPKDMVMTLGRDHNDGYVVPSLDLVFVRLGNGSQFPKDFERDLVQKLLAAVEK